MVRGCGLLSAGRRRRGFSRVDAAGAGLPLVASFEHPAPEAVAVLPRGLAPEERDAQARDRHVLERQVGASPIGVEEFSGEGSAGQGETQFMAALPEAAADILPLDRPRSAFDEELLESGLVHVGGDGVHRVAADEGEDGNCHGGNQSFECAHREISFRRC